jgi:hypothetical protein
MTRRDFILAAAVPFAADAAAAPLVVPVHRVMDSHARCSPEQLRRFWQRIWPEAVRDFSRGGIRLQTTDETGEVGRSAAGRPVFAGLKRDAVNLVLTDHIPMFWDNGRALAGVTTIVDRYSVCMIALAEAHGDQVPFLSVNTCVHELLHVLLQDIFVSRPKWYQSGGREFRIDWYATRMWLFQDGSEVRKSARAYLDRLSLR